MSGKFGPNQPWPSHTKLKLDECYAKFLLEDQFPERYGELELGDCPDLVDPVHGIGIEVTSSDTEENRKLNSLWARAVYLKDGEKKDRLKDHMKLMGMEYTGKVQSFPAQCPSDDPFSHGQYLNFLRAFQMKVDKLNQGHYRKLPDYDLFVHSELYSLPVEWDTMMCFLLHELLLRNQGPCRYHFVYLLGIKALHIWNLARRTYDVRPVEERFLDYDWNARRLVEAAEP